jgi:4-amino-4-deoxy-L-arabinose transferase-like glycosyltransferase
MPGGSNMPIPSDSIVRCVPLMRRIFSNPITALAAGACLRFFFVLKFPAGSGDSALYEQLATNWLKHHVYAVSISGVLTPVGTRMPGYPAFLAIIYWLSGKTGPDGRFWVMSSQVIIDLLTCLVIAATAAALVFLAFRSVRVRRAFTAALWLAALCPFTANYTAVILTETWAIFFTAIALLCLCLLFLRFRGSTFFSDVIQIDMRVKSEWFGAFAGFAAGLGTLFRPETPLLLVVACLTLGWYLLRGRQWLRMIRIFAFMFVGCLLPLTPWAIRNAVTLHEAQLLTPKNANLPGEVVPDGFMAWEKTWLYRMRDTYAVTWKLNDEEIQMDDIPARAFDTPEEKERVAMLLEPYNEDTTFTAEEDAGFAQLAKERTARHPFRTYLWIPLKRASTIWVTPRIELLPYSGNVFPLAYYWEDDPVDQSVTIGLAVLNIVYLALAVWGGWRLWLQPDARTALFLFVAFILVRTAFFTTLEAPEPRYVLECFPAMLAMAAQVFTRKDNVMASVAAPAPAIGKKAPV